ncbi:hypothetical protein SEUCBS139899_007759 [Sporothrix eucalyptigena]|uniref:Uncharacterized protein n=1 Tax=Sporothrix eucalyptigena TaxID=1812306 RepID=A0ABP0B2T6_9PEZI
MEDFVKDVPSLVPRLSIIHAALFVMLPQKEIGDVKDLLQAAGIDFYISLARLGEGIQGMLEENPGHPYGARELPVVYRLLYLDVLYANDLGLGSDAVDVGDTKPWF